MIEYLKVGEIINTHGIKGELKIYPLTDDIKRFDNLEYVYIKEKELFTKFIVEGVKYIKNFPIIKLETIDDINHAQKYKNEYIYVDRKNAVKLPKDSYFIADLIGIDVVTLEGKELGKIVSVFNTGSNDVYEIKDCNGKTILIPAIKEVINNISIEDKKMIISLLEGLI